MSNEIKLTKNNDSKDWEDLEWVDEFYSFLQGELPKGITMPNNPKLSKDQAFNVIWYLQEHFPLIPDQIDRCDVCGTLYDSYSSGWYTEHSNEKGHHNFCDTSCESRYPYPVRDIVTLLREVKDTLKYNETYSFYDLVVLMYEGNGQINRDERYFLEEFFDKDEIHEVEEKEKMKWIESEIARQVKLNQ